MLHNSETENMALLYAYGELPAAKEAAFTEHLKECKECQKILYGAGVVRAALPPLSAPALAPAYYKEQNKTPLFCFHGFNLRHLAPAGVFVLLLAASIISYKVKVDRSVEAYKTSITAMYGDVSSVETEVQEIEDYTDSL